MWIKVCGLKDAANVSLVAGLGPDMMGFIFYEPSPRYAGALDPAVVRALPWNIRRVGVFVDAGEEQILRTAREYGLDTIQLHGDETPDQCAALREKGFYVVKAVGVSVLEDIRRTEEYRNTCDIVLFDTKSPSRGGTGEKFDWTFLQTYDGPPFLLSGGIGPADVQAVAGFRHPDFLGVDLNSRFETISGIKNVEVLRNFIRAVKGDPGGAKRDNMRR